MLGEYGILGSERSVNQECNVFFFKLKELNVVLLAVRLANYI